MTNHYWDRVTAPHDDRDRSEPTAPTRRPMVIDPNIPEWMGGIVGDFSQIAAPAGWAPLGIDDKGNSLGLTSTTQRLTVTLPESIMGRPWTAEDVLHEAMWAGNAGSGAAMDLLHALFVALREQPAANAHCEGHGGPGRWYCCQHPDAGWPCTETTEGQS